MVAVFVISSLLAVPQLLLSIEVVLDLYIPYRNGSVTISNYVIALLTTAFAVQQLVLVLRFTVADIIAGGVADVMNCNGTWPLNSRQESFRDHK